MAATSHLPINMVKINFPFTNLYKNFFVMAKKKNFAVGNKLFISLCTLQLTEDRYELIPLSQLKTHTHLKHIVGEVL